MEPTQTPQVELGPYSERNATGVETAIATLQADPEFIWNEAEKAQLVGFAHELVNGPEEVASLAKVDKLPVVAASKTYYLEYFRTAAGKEELQGLGVEAGASDETITETLFAAVAEGDLPDSKLRETAASHSESWYKATLGFELLDEATTPEQVPDSPVLEVNFVPEKMLAKLEQLQKYRRFYREVRKGLHAAPDSQLKDAKKELLDIHVARVNNLVAIIYPRVLQLADQLSKSPTTEKTVEWRQRLFKAAPLMQLAYKNPEEDHTRFIQAMARRMDLVRNGAAYNGSSNFSPISHELLQLADELDAQDHEQAAPEAVLSKEVIEKLKQANCGPEEFKEITEMILDKWNYLSVEKATWEDVKDRVGAASDGKWQVVIVPKGDPVTTYSRRKMLAISKDFARTLIEALPIVGHELMHMLQAEFSDHLAEQVPLAEVNGRRNLTNKEGGSISVERALFAMLGQKRPTNTTYLRALQTKLAGGNQFAAARAFLNASVGNKKVTSKDLSNKASKAGKSTLRLYRHEGSNSQPLDYLEQELIARGLASLSQEQMQVMAVAGGSFSLKDMATLHRIGLLDLPKKVEHDPAAEVLQIFMDDYYPKLAA